MPVTVIRLSRSRNAAGDLVVRLGIPLLDEYLEFLTGRCRPNTVLAVAYDLKVFFTAVAKPPRSGLVARVRDGPRLLIRTAPSERFLVVASRRAVPSADGHKRPGRAGDAP